jgi:hypothetical protein
VFEIKKIVAAAIAGAAVLMAVSSTATAPADASPLTPACVFAQNFGSSELGGPDCAPLRAYKHIGPYATKDRCEDDKVRQQIRDKRARMVSCSQGRDGYYYMTLFGDMGR